MSDAREVANQLSDDLLVEIEPVESAKVQPTPNGNGGITRAE